MQTWAKRGLQTALVTGGLLMLGTGIASADENVNPDRPASPLDGSVRVPVHFDNNALGTPLGQKDLPSLDKELRVGVDDLTHAVPLADKAAPVVAPVSAKVTDKVADTASPAVADVSGKVDPVLHRVDAQVEPAADKVNATTAKAGVPPLPPLPTMSVPQVDGAFEGNRVDGDLVVPVDVSGNAVALLGAASTENESSQSYGDNESVVTDGSGGFLAGNVVDLDWALPVQITGNAISGLGAAETTSIASQDTAATSDVTSDGSDGVLSGNVLAGHWATPVQGNGNAIAVAGDSQADATADTTATSGGTVLTSGADSLGSGNIGAPPIATPIEANGNALAGAGTADASVATTATATAGGLRDGMYGVPTYLETNGDPAVAAGNIVSPAVSGPALACGNAGAGAGTSSAGCVSDTATTAGGTTRSTGEGSVLSGAAATAPVAIPAEVFGNAGAGAGSADAVADNTVNPTAGGDSYTRGHDSLASGTIASVAPSGPVDVFGNAAAGAGSAASAATQTVDLDSSGHVGTTGDNSVGGGNMTTVPVVTPVEGFGNVAGAAGSATATASEVKTTATDGGGNTDDDNGVLASNNLTAPVAGAVQAFGNGGGALAFTDAAAMTDTEVVSGGDAEATGTAGLGSGNIGQAPVALPAQLFGNGASVLASGDQTAASDTSVTAGGDAFTDGQNGLLSGNVASGPLGGMAQAYGESAAAIGMNEADACSATTATAGGDVGTDGSAGLGSGNVVSPQALGNVQSFAAAASGVGGSNSAEADSVSTATSGGDIDTAGMDGFLAGDIVDVPAGAVVQPFGDAVAAVGSYSDAAADNVTSNAAGGTSTTTGGAGSLSGIDTTVPLGAGAPVYDVPVEVLAQAITDSANVSYLAVGEDAGQLDLPRSGSGMPATEVPALIFGRPAQRALPTDNVTPFAGEFSGVLDGFAGGTSGVPGPDQVGQVAGTVSGASGYHVLPYPAAHSRSDVPSAGDLPLDGTPLGAIPLEVPAVPATPAVPAVRAVPAAPVMPAVPAVPADLSDVTTVLPAMPAVGDLADVSPQLPAVGDADVTHIVPNVPSVGDVNAMPVVAAPALNNLPARDLQGAPALSHLDATSAVDDASLSATRAALASLFTVNPIA